MKTLFLLTKTFPFGHGEQYIENELPVLARFFDKIVLYPCDYFSRNEVHSRQLPSNAAVINLNAQLSGSTLDSTTLYPFKITFNELIRSGNKLAEMLRLKYLVAIARHQWFAASNFWRYAKKNYRGTEAWFYSYWASNGCLMLSMLKSNGYISKMITRAHSIDLYHHDWLLAKELVVPPFELCKFTQADHIYTVSEHGSVFLKKKYPGFADKISCAYLGVPDAGLNPGLPPVFRIVTCSNLSANKRLAELAKAVREVQFPLEWVHFGDGEQRAEIESISKTLPTTKRIVLRGQTANSEVRHYLATHPVNVFVNLSKVEGLPVSIMEAISAGVPVIATQIYGNPEIAQNSLSGITLPANFSIQELSGALTRLQQDAKLQQNLRAGARALYEAQFSAEKNYSAFAQNILLYSNKIN